MKTYQKAVLAIALVVACFAGLAFMGEDPAEVTHQTEETINTDDLVLDSTSFNMTIITGLDICNERPTWAECVNMDSLHVRLYDRGMFARYPTLEDSAETQLYLLSKEVIFQDSLELANELANFDSQ